MGDRNELIGVAIRVVAAAAFSFLSVRYLVKYLDPNHSVNKESKKRVAKLFHELGINREVELSDHEIRIATQFVGGEDVGADWDEIGGCEELVARFFNLRVFNLVDEDDRRLELLGDGEHGGSEFLRFSVPFVERRLLCRALCVFAPNLDLWSKKNNDGETPIGMTDDPNIKRDLQSLSQVRSTVDSHHMAFNKVLIDRKIQESKEKNKTNVILSLDGGGLRVLLQCSILLAIEREIGEPLRNRVHWVAGTSCGGIMSSSMSVGIDLSDAMRIYIIVRKRIFGDNTQMLPKHSSLGIETVLKEVMGPKTSIASCSSLRLVVITAKVTLAPPQLILFRSYAPRISSKEYEQLGYFNRDKILLWKATRLPPLSTSRRSTECIRMADGAIFCNNPCIMVMTEFAKLKKIENYQGKKKQRRNRLCDLDRHRHRTVVSHQRIDINLTNAITGITGNWREVYANAKNLITVFLYQCTTSHNVHVGQSREWAHSMEVPFFRFSPHLAASFELENCKIDEIVNAMFDNEIYIRPKSANKSST